MTSVLGVDSSLTCSGVALVEWDTDRGPFWQTWRARSSAPDVPSVLATRFRMRSVLREILAFVPDRLDLSVVEGAAFTRRRGLADERAGLRWMLIDQLFGRGPVATMSPTSRSMLACGHGRADKPVVLAAVRKAWPGAHVPDHNVADAVALAAAGAARLGLPVPYSPAQVAAHARVAWPVGGPVPAGKRERS